MFNIRLSTGEFAKKVIRQPRFLLYTKLGIFFITLILPWKFLYDYELVNLFFTYLVIWSGFCLVIIFLKYLSWLTNIYLITNKKIILVKFNFLTKKVTEIEIENITNIVVHKNLFQNFFNLGDLKVSIIGQLSEFHLANIENPESFKSEIL